MVVILSSLVATFLKKVETGKVNLLKYNLFNLVYPKYYHSICSQCKQSLRYFTFFHTESSKSGVCLDFTK